MTARLSPQAGMALVEVLVATLILLAALGTLYQVIGSGTRAATSVALAREGLLLAQSRLAAVGAEIPLRPGRYAGREGGLSWLVEIRPYAGAGSGALGPVLLVSVRVEPEGGGRAAEGLTLRSLRLAAR